MSNPRLALRALTVTRSTVVAAVGLSLAVFGGLGGLVVRAIWPAPILPTTFGVGSNAFVVIAWLGISWSAVGALLEIRRPDIPIGRLMILVGCGLALSVLTVAVAFAALAEGSAGGRQVASVAGALTSLLSPILVLVFYLPFIFPTGRGQTPRWGTIGRIFVLIAMVLETVLVLHPGDVHLLPGIPNAIGFGPDLRPVFGDVVAGGVNAVGIVTLAPLLILSVASRYRSAGPIERQQLKWFIFSIAATAGAGTIMFLGVVLANGPIGETPLGEAPLIAFALAASSVPLAIAIAILRYRLFEIDRIVSRTIGYAGITAVLAGVFAVAALSLGIALGSMAEGDTVAVAASTLLVVALFGPVRQRAQTLIDRRFDRSHYDATRTVQALTARLRDDVDLARVEADVLGVVDRTFHPAKAGLWLR